MDIGDFLIKLVSGIAVIIMLLAWRWFVIPYILFPMIIRLWERLNELPCWKRKNAPLMSGYDVLNRRQGEE